ncbi:MAG: hypothetical protein OHK0056_12260 [Bacteriovoracaceae bacterium]
MKIFLFFTLFSFLQNSWALDCLKGESEKKVSIDRYRHLETLNSNSYQNLKIDEFKNAKISDYDYLRIKVDARGLKGTHQLFITIQDDQSKNYWSQLNHVASLTNGISSINVPLKQLLGERGSNQNRRQINYQQLKKVFLVLNPEKNSDARIKWGEVQLIKLAVPSQFKNLLAFDFISERDHGEKCFKLVDQNSLYQKKNGFGFVNPKIWRTEDSQYADNLNRDVIYLNQGEFKVDVPNGAYKVMLNWNALGLWDPPFWKKRSLSVEGKTLVLETRDTTQDFLNDLLQFEQIIPNQEDHPFDLYLSKLMKPLEFDVEVKDGSLDFSFSGDASGVALNWMLIAPASQKMELSRYYQELSDSLRTQFDHLMRRVRGEKAFSSSVSKVQVSLDINRSTPEETLTTNEGEFSFGLIKGLSQLINIKMNLSNGSNGKIDLIFDNKEDQKLFEIEFFRAIPQFVSLDRNHESYQLMTQFLTAMNDGSFEVRPRENHQFFVRLKLRSVQNSFAQIKAKLQVSESQKVVAQFPLSIQLYRDELIRPDFPVGFIGLNSLKFSYFESVDAQTSRDTWDQKSLEFLASRGFTAFTGLPGEAHFEGGLDTNRVLALISRAQNLGFVAPYFSYGGEFLHQFFENGSKEGILKEKATLNEFLSKTSKTPIIFQFSDEPTGYAQTLERDLARGKFLIDNFKGLKLGAFTHFNKLSDPEAKLVKMLSEVSLSSVSVEAMAAMKKWGINWGLYNQAQGALDDPREAFGKELYARREQGLSHYLEWHMSALINYPYYDLDGREADVAMAYPSSNGRLNPSIKFEQAAAGLEDFMLMIHLKKIKKSLQFPPKNLSGQKWRDALIKML